MLFSGGRLTDLAPPTCLSDNLEVGLLLLRLPLLLLLRLSMLLLLHLALHLLLGGEGREWNPEATAPEQDRGPGHPE